MSPRLKVWREVSYEMILGCPDFLASEHDPVLEAWLDGYVERMSTAAARDANGYLITYTHE